MPYADPEAKKANDRAYYLKHRQKMIERATIWNKEHRERSAAHKKAWFEKNPEYSREWYLANRERFLEQTKVNARRRREEEPERMKAMARDSVARRRARQRAAYVEKVDPIAVWWRDQGRCQICGKRANGRDWHLDHIVPIVRGGEHSYANVQVSHPYCNRSKAAS